MSETRFDEISRTVRCTKDIVRAAQAGKTVLVIVKDGPGLAKMKTGLIALGIDQEGLERVTRINARAPVHELFGRYYDCLFVEPTAYETYPFSVARLLVGVEPRVKESDSE